MAGLNPYEAPDPAGLPKRKNGSLDPLQRLGIIVAAVAIVAAYWMLKYGLGALNAWLLGRDSCDSASAR